MGLLRVSQRSMSEDQGMEIFFSFVFDLTLEEGWHVFQTKALVYRCVGLFYVMSPHPLCRRDLVIFLCSYKSAKYMCVCWSNRILGKCRYCVEKTRGFMCVVLK